MPATSRLTVDPSTRQTREKAVAEKRHHDRPRWWPRFRRGDVEGGRPALRFWRELLIVAAFYVVYTAIRDIRGTTPVSASVAFHHARWIIASERAVGVYREAAIQHAFLHAHFVVAVLDVWYGSTHFVVTGAVLVLLFFRFPGRYRIGRNALAGTTILALVGFAFFPLMPPRLLPPGYGFVDTLQTVGGLWAFNSGPMPDLSNQFAAMPSLHLAWALWCAVALMPVLRRWWSKVLLTCYPAITLICVVVTGNHYLLDVVVGAAIVAVAFAVATLVAARPAAQPAVPFADG